jgi:3-oxoacyl-[acyl-carrier-protein] synthase-3
MHPKDKSVRTLFGDASAATLVSAVEEASIQGGDWIGPFVLGTDGAGADGLIVEAGGMRKRHSSGEVLYNANGVPRCDANLFMDGPAILTFTLSVIARTVKELLDRSDCQLSDVGLFIFHQAGKHMLDILRKKCAIPEDRFVVCVRDFGNTVSSTIPIALHEAQASGRLTPGCRVMVVGFGVGFSWGATLLRWL